VTDSREVLLVLNAGSASIKFCTFERAGESLERGLRGQVSTVDEATRLVAKRGPAVVADRVLVEGPLHHADALASLLEFLGEELAGTRIAGVGHRVVHGGTEFMVPTVVDSSTLARLDRYVPLAPLHQPHNLDAIRQVAAVLPGVPQVACFDTSFHRSVPEVAQLFALPPRFADAGVRRYGFHGLSYEYLASELPRLDPHAAGGRTVAFHLGSGASMCAMRDCRSVATTMGFTALDGLPMGTRSGSLDPGVVLFLQDELGYGTRDVERLLYQESGLLGMSGISGDMRVLLASDEPAARLAIDVFVYRAGRELGSLAAALGGLDAVVFTAGVGENQPEVRARICRDANWLGVELDEDANRAQRRRISLPTSAVAAYVIPADEELMIGRHLARLLGGTGVVPGASVSILSGDENEQG
jgi:acetate kinase